MAELSAFLAAHPDTVLVTVAEAKGSTPREAGSWMLVATKAIHGTIGGGQLEFLAIDRARAILDGREKAGDLPVPLGPAIGQCCGGHVTLEFAAAGGKLRAGLLQREAEDLAAQPQVLVFGAGHVGTALAAALALLPLRVIVVEMREAELAALQAAVPHAGTRLVAMPEEAVRSAPPGSAFIVLTHDHALDFLIASEALDRRDAAYVGLIGSATKKAVFRHQYLAAGGTEDRFTRLICPIGGTDVKDKRPSVIAALTAAEVLRALG